MFDKSIQSKQSLEKTSIKISTNNSTLDTANILLDIGGEQYQYQPIGYDQTKILNEKVVSLEKQLKNNKSDYEATIEKLDTDKRAYKDAYETLLKNYEDTKELLEKILNYQSNQSQVLNKNNDQVIFCSTLKKPCVTDTVKNLEIIIQESLLT